MKRYKDRIAVAAASKFLAGEVYNYKSRKLMMEVIIAGWDLQVYLRVSSFLLSTILSYL